ncbi:hypothetical protein PG987_007321 [Apiospora arundinis]
MASATPKESDSSRKATGPRVVLACVPCRERHVRCGAEQPECRRCMTSGKPCRYAKSRRGGLDRAALEARRRRLEAESAKESTSSSPSVAASDQPRDGRVVTSHRQDRSEEPDWLGMFVETPRSQQSQQGNTNTSPFGISTCEHSPNADYCPDGKSVFPDPNLDNYYLQFHRFHPCVVPKSVLERLVRDPALLERLRPLISVMKYIGSLFNTCSRSKQNGVVTQPVVPERPAPCPFMVQCHLLYSVALYWTDDKPRAYEQLHASIDMAVVLGMHHRAFATEHYAGDAVLAESFRRTWWQLLSVEASTSATDRSFVFRVCEIETTVDLPCEEDEYLSGVIPTPRTWDEYCARELETDGPGYSSFAHLVGAYRSITSALKNIPPLTKPHGSALIMQEIDTVIDGWLHLLPESKREVMSESGDIDELMFQAHMLVHTATLTAHRPFSKLLFHPLETMSSCTTYPSDEHIAKESLIVHTTRCLRAIEAQVRLLALPAERFSHTPLHRLHGDDGRHPAALGVPHPLQGQGARRRPQPAAADHRVSQSAGGHMAAGGEVCEGDTGTGAYLAGGVIDIFNAIICISAGPSFSQATLASPDGVMSDANNEWLSADILAAISSMPTIGAGWNLNDYPPDSPLAPFRSLSPSNHLAAPRRLAVQAKRNTSVAPLEVKVPNLARLAVIHDALREQVRRRPQQLPVRQVRHLGPDVRAARRLGRPRDLLRHADRVAAAGDLGQREARQLRLERVAQPLRRRVGRDALVLRARGAAGARGEQVADVVAAEDGAGTAGGVAVDLESHAVRELELVDWVQGEELSLLDLRLLGDGRRGGEDRGDAASGGDKGQKGLGSEEHDGQFQDEAARGWFID